MNLQARALMVRTLLFNSHHCRRHMYRVVVLVLQVVHWGVKHASSQYDVDEHGSGSGLSSISEGES